MSQRFPLPQTDPAPVYRARDALYAIDFLTAAVVHLDLFTRLAGGPLNLHGICRVFGTVERPTDVLLTLLCALGFLDKRDGAFHVAPVAREHLVEGTPWSLRPYYASFKDRPVCLDLVQVLRTGKTAGWGAKKDAADWAKSMEDPEFATTFTAAMDCRGAFLAPRLAGAVDLTGRSKLLDVAGGSGIYACALADAYPRLAATIYEKPPVDAVARHHLARRGFTDRVGVVAGDMFRDAWPPGFDVHLLSNVIHDWDIADVKRLLQRSHEALTAGGLLVIHDAHLNDDKTGPLEVAEYSVLLLHACEGRCYSVAEMRGWLEEAGFGDVRFTPTAAHRSAIVARKPS